MWIAAFYRAPAYRGKVGPRGSPIRPRVFAAARGRPPAPEITRQLIRARRRARQEADGQDFSTRAARRSGLSLFKLPIDADGRSN